MRLAMGLTGQGFKETAQHIERLAGVVQPSATRPERPAEDKVAALRRVWSASSPIARGDEAERYLVGRGLKLFDLPESIRLHPGLAYREEAGAVVGRFPAMVARVVSPDGQGVSLHRTYLQDGHKAPVASPKKLMQGPPLSGAAIRLTAVSEVLGKIGRAHV